MRTRVSGLVKHTESTRRVRSATKRSPAGQSTRHSLQVWPAAPLKACGRRLHPSGAPGPPPKPGTAGAAGAPAQPRQPPAQLQPHLHNTQPSSACAGRSHSSDTWKLPVLSLPRAGFRAQSTSIKRQLLLRLPTTHRLGSNAATPAGRPCRALTRTKPDAPSELTSPPTTSHTAQTSSAVLLYTSAREAPPGNLEPAALPGSAGMRESMHSGVTRAPACTFISAASAAPRVLPPRAPAASRCAAPPR